MSLARPTRDDVSAYALGLAGRSRDHLPVPWTDSRSMDDCARFCSHVLWGGFPISWVDNFKSAGDGTYAGGSTDLAPWDVLLFDWEGNGVGNHVEFMVGDYGNGTVRTFGANGSDTRAAAYRVRPTRYIMGRFRPAWTTTPTNAARAAEQDDDMPNIAVVGISASPVSADNALWIADFGAKTKWNAAAGGLTAHDAENRVGTLMAMTGARRFENQAPSVLAGFRDITREK